MASLPAGLSGHGLTKGRPKITRSNIVCAEPMPGETELLKEFLATLKQDCRNNDSPSEQVPEGSLVQPLESMVEASAIGFVRLVWDRMQLAGEAGSLLKIEEVAGCRPPGSGRVGREVAPVQIH